jgi:hypothetical protein
MRTNPVASRGMKARKMGVVEAMTTMVPRMLKPYIEKITNSQGRVLSVANMSVENLFTMRPNGVVSKKLIGFGHNKINKRCWLSGQSKKRH